MNRNRHRIVFNAARGQRVAVSEAATACICSPGQMNASPGPAHAAVQPARRHLLLRQSMVVLLAFGGSFLLPAHAQIAADPSAPGKQRPTILTAPNGVPLVNIQTPSAAGVSRNTYRQFDVDGQGTILNNSRTNTATQLGGWVQGNPWLANGGARVILNEVNSANPSYLNGYVEVAGQRAEVIIANPAGIQVNGGGFINAAGVTLTTGAPMMSAGALESFRVQRGQVRIEGLGLDTRTADHTTILTRAMQVNAGIWANDLNVLLGAGETQAGSLQTTPLAGAGPAPTFLLDVAAIGGMYAGKIRLLGTEAGLCVNNQGVVSATAGPIVLDVNGLLRNTGTLQAQGNLEVVATDINNTATGQIVALSTSLQATDALVNRGVIDGAQTHLQADTVTNIGTGLILGDHLAIAATQLTNDTETLNNVRADAVLAARERLDLGISDTLTNREHALIFSAGSTGDALNIGGALDADLHAVGKANNVNNHSATIESLGGLTISAAQLNNANLHFSTQLDLVGGPTRGVYIQPDGTATKLHSSNFVWEAWSRAGQYRYKTAPPVNNSGVLGQSPIPRVGEQDCVGDEPDEVCTRQPGADYLPGNAAWAYFSITPPTPEPTAPTLSQPTPPDAAGASSCEAGAGYNAGACATYTEALTTHQSEKSAYDAAWSDYNQMHDAWVTDTDARYTQLDNRIATYNNRFADDLVRYWTQYDITRTEHETRVVTSDPGQILSGGNMRLRGDELVNDKSRIVAGGELEGDLVNLRNIEAEGVHIVHETGTAQYTYADWRGGTKRYHQRRWGPVEAYSPADVVTPVTLSVAQLLEGIEPSGPAGIGLPGSGSLFKPSQSPNATYLIETDPRFANYRQWLGSDYLLAALSTDPATVQKRLGDGFLEQKLVREQVAALTGRRFLDDHTNDEALFRALMDAGATYARAWNLVPGVALSAEQVAHLTSDIVWLEAQTVELPDGTATTALVPKVYLKPRSGDLAPTGALLAGQRVDLRLSGDLTNAGTIAGRDVVTLNAQNVHHLAGRIEANRVAIEAAGDLNVVGGEVHARDALHATAGRDLTVRSTTVDTGAGSFTRTGVNRVAGLYVTGDNATLLASAGRDMHIVAGVLASQGDIDVDAGRNVGLGTVQTRVHNAVRWDDRNYNVAASSAEVGSVLAADGNVTITAGNDVRARAAQINSGQSLTLEAGHDVAITAGESTEQFGEGRHRSSSGLLSSRSSTTRLEENSSTAVGSQLNAQDVNITAGRDVAIEGNRVNAQDLLLLDAGRDVTIASAQDTQSGSSFAEEKKSGFNVSKQGLNYGKSAQTGSSAYSSQTQVGSTVSGGDVVILSGRDTRVSASTVVADDALIIDAGRDVSIVSAVNTHTQEQSSHNTSKGMNIIASGVSESVTIAHDNRDQGDGTSTTTTAATSTMGSLGGDVTITAGRRYQQTGSDVLALEGDIDIQAQTVNITEARKTRSDTRQQSSKSTVLGATPRNPVIDLVKSAASAVETAGAIGDTGNSRVQALGAAVTALNVYNTANQAAALMANPMSAASVTIDFNLGSSKSRSESTETADAGRASSVAAAGDVRITASGAGTDSDIHIRGSDVSAGNNALIKAEGDVLLESSQDRSTLHSTNTSSGASIGVGVSFGASNGITFNASANQANGNAEGQDVIQRNTHIVAGHTARIESGADTTLAGASVNTKTVQAEVGGSLNIESRQDTSTFTSDQQSSGWGVSLCIPPFCYGASSVTASGAAQNIESRFASVTEQSGLKAGDGGFQVNVHGDTTLTGGAITSTDQAVEDNRNSFTTGGELTLSDVENRASYGAEGYSVNLAVAVQGSNQGPLTPEQKSKAPANAAKNEGSAGIGEDSGEASSTTQAAISDIAGNKDARTGDAEAGIAPIFDQNRVQKEIDAQVLITAEFGKSAASAWGTYANKKFTDAVTAGDEEAASCWAPDGGCRAGGHALIGGLSGGAGGAAGAGISSAAAPHVQAFLVANGVPVDAAKAITQLSALGAGAAVGAAAGASAGFNEASNNAVQALPLLVEAIAGGGALAARACLSSPTCLNALRLGGTALVAKVASLVDPADLAKIPGFESNSPDPAGGNTASPAPAQGGNNSTTTPGTAVGNPGTPPSGADGPLVGDSTTVSPGGTSGAGSTIMMNINGQNESVVLPSLIDPAGATHILVGDRPGSGGHLWPGQPGKTPFPQGWDADKVLGVVSDVATDPASHFESAPGGRIAVSGVREGVEIRVILEPPRKGGRIVTAHPTNLPRNP